MIKQLLSKLRIPHNVWYRASQSEIGRLYIARVMRTIATQLGSAFMTVYLLKTGYSIVAISLFWAAYYGLKVVITLPIAQIIANIGPKKSMMISNLLFVPSLFFIIFVGQIGILAMIASVILQSVSASLNNTAHLISFSKIKSMKQAGRDVALMSILEKVAKGLSPLVGGLIAMFFGPQVSIAASAIFFIFAAYPLLRTPETIDTKFKLKPRNFPWRIAMNSILIQLPIGFDVYSSGNAWSIFLATLIFTAGGNQIYAKLGALASFILVISVISTYLYGKLIDKRAGRQLIIWSTIGSVVANIFRAFTRVPAMAIGTNALDEVAVTGYSMACMRGVFDVADQTGYRVFYIAMTEMVANAGACIAALLLSLIASLFVGSSIFIVFYIIAAAVVSTLAFAKFRVYSTT